MTIFMFANNVNTTLAGPVSTDATTLTLSNTANLPATIANGEVLVITLNDAATRQNFEIVYATARTGATLSVLRAQEGTAALAWLTGDYAFSPPTAGQQGSFGQTGAPNTWTGTNTFAQGIIAPSISTGGSAPLFLESNNYVAAVNNGNTSYVQLYCAVPSTLSSAVTLGYSSITYAAINGSASQPFSTANLAVTGNLITSGSVTASGVMTNVGACGFDTSGTGSSFGGNLTAGGWITANGSVVRSASVFGYLNNTGAGNSGSTNSLGFGVYTTSGMQASQFWTLSDRRVKTEIESLDESESINFVKSVTPVIYKKNGAEIRERGFLAQDVGKAVGGNGIEMLNFIDQKGLPEQIDPDGYVSPKDTLLVVDYNQVLPVHASVLRNLLTRIEKLESQKED